MAQNADFVCGLVTRYISERLGIATEFVNNIPWQQRELLLDAERIQVCWICGLPYVWKTAEPRARIELLVAPIMSGQRYRDRPIYFSDIVVHRESSFRTFADLRGASWVYNEPRSHSGFNIVRHHLATLGEAQSFFGQIIESGSHQASLQMILCRKADVSAIEHGPGVGVSAEFRTAFCDSGARYAGPEPDSSLGCAKGLAGSSEATAKKLAAPNAY
jgi:phosphonate transport system substrate-binding protein